MERPALDCGEIKEAQLAYIIVYFTIIAAWITHIVVAIAAKAWLFMIVGALLFPVAVAHGISVWLGFDWLH